MRVLTVNYSEKLPGEKVSPKRSESSRSSSNTHNQLSLPRERVPEEIPLLLRRRSAFFWLLLLLGSPAQLLPDFVTD